MQGGVGPGGKPAKAGKAPVPGKWQCVNTCAVALINRPMLSTLFSAGVGVPGPYQGGLVPGHGVFVYPPISRICTLPSHFPHCLETGEKFVETCTDGHLWSFLWNCVGTDSVQDCQSVIWTKLKMHVYFLVLEPNWHVYRF